MSTEQSSAQAEASSSPEGASSSGAYSDHKRKRGKFRLRSLSYTTRVTFYFAAIAAMTALIAIGVVSIVWQQHFQQYTAANMQSVAEMTANRIEARYEAVDAFTPYVLDPANSAVSLTDGIGMQVTDASGEVVYDSAAITIDESSGAKAPSLAPSQRGSNMATAPIEVDGQVVGHVNVWVYGSDTLLRSSDLQFRDESYAAMAWAAIVAIVVASIIGYFFARSLVRPIKRMTRTAEALKEGDFQARTGLTGKDEMARLGQTFDDMAESIERDRKLERRLTTDVAHELRTPLMAIQATVEAMVDGVFPADEEHLVTVNSEVQRLSRLVDSLLKLSRLENRSTPMKEEILNVGDLIRQIIITHDAYVTEAGLTLKYEAEDDVYVKGDPDMIRQATANLISNAVRYTPEGGTVTVTVSQEDDVASIAVRDTGIGLTPEEARMVFSRFWRADAGRNRASGGLGIGLSVVKEIVDRHHGWVDVEGKKDVGSCFTLHFPVYDEEAEEREGARAQRKGRSHR